ALSREWIARNLPAGSTVAIENYAPFIDPAKYHLLKLERAIDQEPDWYVEHNVDYLVLSQGMFRRYFNDPKAYAPEVGAYLRLMHAFTQLERFGGADFEVAVYSVKSAPRE